ncbi:hypothetical protein TNCT_479641 [Trichonephila clavata]|uniref:Uncharacterized protein n=1 Tax=Trichonephila clavata TaxID=2740835 RepID=A0A8X6H5Y4_TRICU|nr:hypothetical protein TNCT_479641 [Trichonephila clavata]
MFTGEHVSVKLIIDDLMTCLPLAEEIRQVKKESGFRTKCLPRPDIVNEIQTQGQRRKAKKSPLENKDDQFGFEEDLVENEENLVPSFTNGGKDTRNLIKINADEFIEAQLKSEESALLIQKIENCMNSEASDKEKPPMQLVHVRREIFSKLNIARVGPLSIIPAGNEYIKPDVCVTKVP